MSKRKFFSLGEKVKIVNYAEKNPHLSSRKLAEEYGCGSTFIQTLIRQKDVILTDWKCHENYFFQKRLTKCIKIECYRIYSIERVVGEVENQTQC